jgi:anion-transporting  ArsA/GET3 family ATPase
MTARDTDWDGVRLHVVTGKGRQGIARLFDRPPLPYGERKIAIGPGEAEDGRDPGGDVYALAIDPEGALLDYLQMFYNMRGIGSALNKLGMVDFATTIAPGLTDVLITGKATEATRRKQPGSSSGFVYDAIVLDAPPTGRIGRFLNVSAEVSGLAKVGPIRVHADSVANVIKSPQTAVHFVCTLEEMPVQETLDGIAEMRAIGGMQVGGIMINKTPPAVLSREQLKEPPDLAAMAEALDAAGLHSADALAAALAQELAEHARNVELADLARADLDTAGQPTYELPMMAEGIDLAALHRLAADLRDQGAA